MIKPTKEQYSAYQGMFDYFNKSLFGNKLSNVILSFSRAANSRGFFAPQRWRGGDKVTHEIALNPQSLQRESFIALSTLVHEMAHLWQEEYGEPSRTGYHNKEWAEQMESIGLMPSHTGEEGGKRTGQNMTHFIIKGGQYDIAFKRMPPNLLFPFQSLESEQGSNGSKKSKKKNKFKYSCPVCDCNAWGKEALNLICGDCTVQMIMEEPDQEKTID